MLKMGDETSMALRFIVVVNVELIVDVKAINNITKNTCKPLGVDVRVIFVTVNIIICSL